MTVAITKLTTADASWAAATAAAPTRGRPVAANAAATVDVNGVSKRFGRVEAVRDVTFELPEGRTIALVGHNGAGKTTLMKMMLGLIRPTEGSIRVMGDDPAAGEFAARRRLGYLPENVSFNAALTGRETLSFYARLKREPAASVAPLLYRVGLGAAADRRIGTYSKGMRQRLGLAQALLGDPRVLLLDEPTTGLDPSLRRTFYDIVGELRDRGATVLLSSHALTELEERAELVVIMNRGIMVANGSLNELRRLARLPTRIRLTLPDPDLGGIPNWLGSAEGWRRTGPRVIEIDAAPETKIALLRRVSHGPVQDIEVIPPTLDELFVHFLRSQEDSG